jgi:cell division protein FtsI/penicillin-binding protein 2
MDLRSRLVPIAFAFLLVAGAIAWRLGVLQVAQHEFWEEAAVQARTRAVALPFRRGAILDARGRPLATTRTTFDLEFEFAAFRKGAVAGQLLLAHFLLTEERVSVARVLAEPEPFVREFAALTIGEMRRIEPGARRADLLVYGAWLGGETRTKDLVARLRTEPDDEPCCPRLSELETDVVAQVRAEAAFVAELERALALPPGELVKRVDEAIRATDARVAKLLARRGVATEKLYERERELHKDADDRLRTLARNVPHRAVFDLAADPSRLPGFVVNERARRVYSKELDVAAPLIGRVGAPSDTTIEKWEDLRDERDVLADEIELAALPTLEQSRRLNELDEQLRTEAVEADDEVGVEGLEASAEPVLRGRRGFRRSEADRASGAQRVLEIVEPVAGRDVQLTLDVDLQRAAEAALARGAPVEKGGAPQVFPAAFVLIELPDMEVRVLASYPAPSRAELAEKYEQLADPKSELGKLRPLHPRAWRPYLPPPPGSSIKPLVAAFALSAGVIVPGTTFECTRDRLTAPGEKKPIKCEGLHGDIDAREAIVVSCNHFFAHVAYASRSERMVAWLRSVGLGSRTGFTGARLGDGSDLPPLELEVAGHAAGEAGGRNLMLLGMGQGKVDATPLQMAAAMGALATRRWRPPTMIARVGGERPLAPAAVDLPIDAAAWNLVVAAMRQVTRAGGTASPDHVADLSPYDLATKTGTPEPGRTTDPSHSWFVGFFPSRAPRYAFAVFRESTGRHGGDGAAPILRDLLEDPAFAEIAAAARGAPTRDPGAPPPEGGP